MTELNQEILQRHKENALEFVVEIDLAKLNGAERKSVELADGSVEECAIIPLKRNFIHLSQFKMVLCGIANLRRTNDKKESHYICLSSKSKVIRAENRRNRYRAPYIGILEPFLILRSSRTTIETEVNKNSISDILGGDE